MSVRLGNTIIAGGGQTRFTQQPTGTDETQLIAGGLVRTTDGEFYFNISGSNVTLTSSTDFTAANVWAEVGEGVEQFANQQALENFITDKQDFREDIQAAGAWVNVGNIFPPSNGSVPSGGIAIANGSEAWLNLTNTAQTANAETNFRLSPATWKQVVSPAGQWAVLTGDQLGIRPGVIAFISPTEAYLNISSSQIIVNASSDFTDTDVWLRVLNEEVIPEGGIHTPTTVTVDDIPDTNPWHQIGLSGNERLELSIELPEGETAPQVPIGHYIIASSAQGEFTRAFRVTGYFGTARYVFGNVPVSSLRGIINGVNRTTNLQVVQGLNSVTDWVFTTAEEAVIHGVQPGTGVEFDVVGDELFINVNEVHVNEFTAPQTLTTTAGQMGSIVPTSPEGAPTVYIQTSTLGNTNYLHFRFEDQDEADLFPIGTRFRLTALDGTTDTLSRIYTVRRRFTAGNFTRDIYALTGGALMSGNFEASLTGTGTSVTIERVSNDALELLDAEGLIEIDSSIVDGVNTSTIRSRIPVPTAEQMTSPHVLQAGGQIGFDAAWQAYPDGTPPENWNVLNTFTSAQIRDISAFTHGSVIEFDDGGRVVGKLTEVIDRGHNIAFSDGTDDLTGADDNDAFTRFRTAVEELAASRGQTFVDADSQTVDADELPVHIAIFFPNLTRTVEINGEDVTIPEVGYAVYRYVSEDTGGDIDLDLRYTLRSDNSTFTPPNIDNDTIIALVTEEQYEATLVPLGSGNFEWRTPNEANEVRIVNSNGTAAVDLGVKDLNLRDGAALDSHIHSFGGGATPRGSLVYSASNNRWEISNDGSTFVPIPTASGTTYTDSDAREAVNISEDNGVLSFNDAQGNRNSIPFGLYRTIAGREIGDLGFDFTHPAITATDTSVVITVTGPDAEAERNRAIATFFQPNEVEIEDVNVPGTSSLVTNAVATGTNQITLTFEPGVSIPASTADDSNIALFAANREQVHNVSDFADEFATAAQGALADTALQSVPDTYDTRAVADTRYEAILGFDRGTWIYDFVISNYVPVDVDDEQIPTPFTRGLIYTAPILGVDTTYYRLLDANNSESFRQGTIDGTVIHTIDRS